MKKIKIKQIFKKKENGTDGERDRKKKITHRQKVNIFCSRLT